MTLPNDPRNPMPDNPGDPGVTDEENLSPAAAEAAADEAEARAAVDAEADLAEEALVDPEVVDAEAELVDIDAELQELVDAEQVDTDAAAELGEDDDTSDAVAAANAKVAELTDDVQRLNAEYANYRRRTERERSVELVRARAAVAAEFLPVLDELDMAAAHGDLKEGPLKAFADKLRGILTTLGVERFGAEGEEFNPERHEAIQDTSSGEVKVLGTVVRPGYMFKDQLIRNAMVIISDPVDGTDTP